MMTGISDIFIQQFTLQVAKKFVLKTNPPAQSGVETIFWWMEIISKRCVMPACLALEECGQQVPRDSVVQLSQRQEATAILDNLGPGARRARQGRAPSGIPRLCDLTQMTFVGLVDDKPSPFSSIARPSPRVYSPIILGLNN